MGKPRPATPAFLTKHTAVLFVSDANPYWRCHRQTQNRRAAAVCFRPKLVYSIQIGHAMGKSKSVTQPANTDR
ncbi:hypothetical protein SLA2020_432820 [Shorea laevis]